MATPRQEGSNCAPGGGRRLATLLYGDFRVLDQTASVREFYVSFNKGQE
jgi:hypothetical protein